MPSVIDGILGNNYIANGLSGPVFQAAIENRGVFENIDAKAGAMYMCTGEIIQVNDGVYTYGVPKVIAVEGPGEPPKGVYRDYKIRITFDDNKKVTSAQLVEA